ncbi:MAG: DUF1836 domain-containing protein [Oscillospiraceae bacterium]|nr:DUF1836 domain-containing protein [Oscillospiraceae bacterium]MBQ5748749.1 DUF1836 domain-containing protein [Oscillospiraceae bacterium]
MEHKFFDEMALPIRFFRLPRYEQLPEFGLYLEQTTQYINQCLRPLGFFEITGSMIRNYVKMGLVKNPVQKRYDRDQISRLIVITLLKPALSLENIQLMLRLQSEAYADEMAYNYFAMELENVLFYRFGITPSLEQIGVTESVEKEMARSAITAISHMIYLNSCFRQLSDGTET